MLPFRYSAVADAPAALRVSPLGGTYLAGGTTLVDLMKLGVVAPSHVIDITGVDATRYAGCEFGPEGLRLGALARMSDVARNRDVQRLFPVIAQSLSQAASAQIRNMARLGGNVLQRTRCSYFRDTSFAQCNKRSPGSGCAAIDGVNRGHAVLGGSDACVATYPGDFAQALIALDARVEILGRNGPRAMRFADLHRIPGARPDLETTLAPGDLLLAFVIPGQGWPRSLYRKIRERDSYAFALASAAVALRIESTSVREVRIALGGVATKPWRAREAEELLVGRTLDEASAVRAADVAFADARPQHENGYKVALGKATLVRALLEAAELPA